MSIHDEGIIVKALKQLRSGCYELEYICARNNISRETLYEWKFKYEGLNSTHIALARQRELEVDSSIATYTSQLKNRITSKYL